MAWWCFHLHIWQLQSAQFELLLARSCTVMFYSTWECHVIHGNMHRHIAFGSDNKVIVNLSLILSLIKFIRNSIQFHYSMCKGHSLYHQIHIKNQCISMNFKFNICRQIAQVSKSHLLVIWFVLIEHKTKNCKNIGKHNGIHIRTDVM